MKLHVPILLRWSDLDAYGHVNNAAMLRLLEEARIQAFWLDEDAIEPALGASTAVLDGRPGAATLTLIARLEAEYLAQIPYLRQPVVVRLWLGKLGGASLEVCYEVWSPDGVLPAVLYARASTTIVLVDAATERPRKISPTERDAWTPYLDEPIRFTRRASVPED
ncbi:acyl-CoA thioesterase [Cryobacterium algoritolerans]|uniref:Acyl-CoA thioesterase n=1 Tax=Cryobacterium algoritolerans TaxID=1259184 RepID=A0A4V3IF09_9MICO|nr:thioesterase family protein [Cryobacterium algoritolerans]TFC15229.1 acyl-CoA thioesterase [Cryobacterium algoritolerans]